MVCPGENCVPAADRRQNARDRKAIFPPQPRRNCPSSAKTSTPCCIAFAFAGKLSKKRGACNASGCKKTGHQFWYGIYPHFPLYRGAGKGNRIPPDHARAACASRASRVSAATPESRAFAVTAPAAAWPANRTAHTPRIPPWPLRAKCSSAASCAAIPHRGIAGAAQKSAARRDR